MEKQNVTDWNALPPDTASLAMILKKLRSPDGCPWDKEQTRQTLSRSLAEEAAELLEAIDTDDVPHIAEELGDLLMNVVFQAVVAEEKGDFTLEDVVRGINSKMIRRHRHIFGDAECSTSEDVRKLWEQIKAEEKGEHKPASVLDGIPVTLSALNSAEKIQKKVSKYGFDWQEESSVLDKIAEELQEVKEAMTAGDDKACEEELGDLLFAVVNLVRFRKQSTSEELLRKANRKFVQRFQFVEKFLQREGIPLEDAGTEKLEALWQEAKKHE